MISSSRKRGQGLALNTVIIAALVLIVLLIVIAIIYGTSGKVLPFFNKQTECTARGGACQAESDSCGGTKVYGLGDCKAPKPVCCIIQQT